MEKSKNKIYLEKYNLEKGCVSQMICQSRKYSCTQRPEVEIL
jgi:hypothetical protein